MAKYTNAIRGLLGGIGTGLMEKADRELEELRFEREQAIKRAAEDREREFRAGEYEKDREQRSTEAQKDRDFQSGQVRGAASTTEGLMLYTGGGEVTEHRSTVGAPRNPSASSLKPPADYSADDKRLVEGLLEGNPRVNSRGEEVPDYEKVRGILADKYPDRPELLDMVPTKEITEDDPEWLDYLADAQEEARKKAPGLSRLLPGDQTAQAFDGLTEEEWANNRAIERFENKTHQKAPIERVPLPGEDGGGNKPAMPVDRSQKNRPSEEDVTDEIPADVIQKMPEGMPQRMDGYTVVRRGNKVYLLNR